MNPQDFIFIKPTVYKIPPGKASKSRCSWVKLKWGIDFVFQVCFRLERKCLQKVILSFYNTFYFCVINLSYFFAYSFRVRLSSHTRLNIIATCSHVISKMFIINQCIHRNHFKTFDATNIHAKFLWVALLKGSGYVG